MRNLIAIVVVALCFVSVGFGQAPKKVEEKIDTARFIQILESEFNFQVNEYRRSLGLDTIPTNTELKMLCEKNNERLSRYQSFFEPTSNKEYRKYAHDSLQDRINAYYFPTKKHFQEILHTKFDNGRISYVNEIVASDRKVDVTNDISKIKKLAYGYVMRFSYSKDHNEVLVSPLCFTLYTKFSVVEVGGVFRLVVTSCFTEYEQ